MDQTLTAKAFRVDGAFALGAARTVWAGDVIVHIPAAYLQATGAFKMVFDNGETIDVTI